MALSDKLVELTGIGPVKERQALSVVHFLSGLTIGGKEAASLRLARKGLAGGDNHRLLLYDTPYRSPEIDFDPAGVPLDFLQRHRGFDMSLARRLNEYLRRQRANVLHAYNDTAIFYAALALGPRPWSATSLVAAFHSWPSYPTRASRILTRWACGTTRNVVAVSSDLRLRLVTEGWTNHCGVIPNGVDLDLFNPEGLTDNWRDRLRVPPNGILIGHIGRFDQIKRHRDLILAARILERDAPNVVVAMVGQGPLLNEMRALSAGATNIRFVSHVTPTAPLLRALDIFTLCSEYEAAPLVLLEAMACGVASVVTSVGGIPEIVGAEPQDACAIQVPPRSPDDLASALAMLAGSQGMRNALGQRARRRALAFLLTMSGALTRDYIAVRAAESRSRYSYKL